MPAGREDSANGNLAKTAGFSLLTGVAAKAHQQRKLDRLCRYMDRPALATPDGKGALNYAQRRPKGVIAVVCPWNLQLLLKSWIAFGLKPKDNMSRYQWRGTLVRSPPARNEDS